MKPSLKVIDGDLSPGRWRLPKPSMRGIGIALLASGLAGWVGLLLTTHYQTLLVGVTVLAVVMTGWSMLTRRVETMPQHGVQIVRHYHYRRWFALALLLPLLSAPQQARADISFGDLKDALDWFGGKWIQETIDSLCAYLLFPQPNLPAMDVAAPLPEPKTGGFPWPMPVSPAEGIAAAEQITADQKDRVDTVENIIQLSAAATAVNADQLKTLNALSLADPTSVAAVGTLISQASVASASAAATNSQMQAADVAMRAAEIMDRERARSVEMQQLQQFANYGAIGSLAPEFIKLARR
jgi:hypothetical protein